MHQSDPEPTTEPGTPGDEKGRLSVLEETVGVYRGYLASGYSSRWEARTAGEQLALAERTDWVLTAAAPARSGTLVDLGCGGGWLGVALDQAGRRPTRYIGVDLLDERIEIARTNVPWGEFLTCSADQVPLPDASIDAVVAVTLFSSLTAEWFRFAVAAEIDRLIRPGGRVAIYDLRYRSPSNPHVVPITVKEVRRLFPGWSVETATYLTLLPPIMRSWLGGSALRYRALTALPFLRSHLAVVLRKL